MPVGSLGMAGRGTFRAGPNHSRNDYLMSLAHRRFFLDADRRGPRRVRRAGRRAPISLILEPLEARRLLTTYTVSNTNDNGLGSLRQAILDSNANLVANNIDFQIPASIAPNLDVPVAGFNPTTQDWTITLNSALPTVTNTVDIDGFSQAHLGTPYAYPV